MWEELPEGLPKCMKLDMLEENLTASRTPLKKKKITINERNQVEKQRPASEKKRGF